MVGNKQEISKKIVCGTVHATFADNFLAVGDGDSV